jgi:hypothetical protein
MTKVKKIKYTLIDGQTHVIPKDEVVMGGVNFDHVVFYAVVHNRKDGSKLSIIIDKIASLLEYEEEDKVSPKGAAKKDIPGGGLDLQ